MSKNRRKRLKAQLEDHRRRIDAMQEDMEWAIANGATIVCAECHDVISIDQQYLCLSYVTNRNMIRDCVVHRECIPPELRTERVSPYEH